MSRTTPIPYGRRPGLRRRRWIAFAVLAAVAAASWRWREPLVNYARTRWQIAHLHWLERECLRYDPPRIRLVFDGSDRGFAPLPPAGNGQYMVLDGSAAWVPNSWRSFVTAAADIDDCTVGVLRDEFLPRQPSNTEGIPEFTKGLAFLHPLVSTSGTPRLVCVQVSRVDNEVVCQRQLSLAAFVLVPGTFTQLPVLTDGYANPGGSAIWLSGQLPADHIRLFAGQPDPIDSSRFSIAGEYNGRAFSIDGQLTDHDAVVFRPTTGWRLTDPDDVNPPEYEIAGHEDELVEEPAPRARVCQVSTPNDHSGYWTSIGFTADGQDVVIAGDHQIVRVGVFDDRVRWRSSLPDWDERYPRSFMLAPDGQSVAIAEQSCSVLRLPGLRHLLQVPDNDVKTVGFGRGGLVTSDGRAVKWWNADGPPLPVRRWDSPGPVLSIGAAAKDRRTVVLTADRRPEVGADGEVPAPTVTAWSFAVPTDPSPRPIPLGTMPDASRWIAGGPPCVVSGDGRMLATSFGGSTELDGDELIVDLTVGRIVRRGPPPGEATPDAIFSPDGRLFAWSGVKGVYAADVTGKRVYRFDVPASESPVAFSPDGRLMAAVWEGAVHVWPTPEH